MLGGAAGAVVSVMNRMTGGSLKVRPEGGKKTIRALGFVSGSASGSRRT